MPLPSKPVLIPPPQAPQRGEDRNLFAAKANAFVNWQAQPLQDNLQSSLDWIEDAFDETEIQAINAAASAADALATKNQTDAIALTVAAQASFKGPWIALTGALSVPASVLHLGEYWQLLTNVADVTTEVPGVSAAWQRIDIARTWSIVPTSASITLARRQHAVCNSGGLTLTLPASPAEGDDVAVSVREFTGIVIGRNGQSIMGIAQNLTIDVPNVTVTLRFASGSWRVF